MCLNHLSNEQTGYYWRHQHTQEHTHTLLSFTDRVSDFLDVNSADVNTHTHIHAHTHTHSAIVCWESSWFSGCQQCWCKHTHTHTHTHWYHFLTEFLIFWMLAAPNQTHPPHTHARTHTHTHTLLSFADRVPDFLDVGSTDVLHPTPVGANLSIKEHPLLLPLLLLLGPADKQNQGSETSLHQVNH